MASWRFSIPGPFPTHNAYVQMCMNNRYRAGAMKREWDETVAWHARAAHIPQPTRWPVDVRITVYERDRRRDWDGSTGFVQKTVLDGLQRAGVLPNDNLAHVMPVRPWVEFDREDPRVEVEIVEPDDEGSDL